MALSTVPIHDLRFNGVPVIRIQDVAEFHRDGDGIMTSVEMHPDPFYNPFDKDSWSLVLSPVRGYTHTVVPGHPSQLNPYNIFENGSLFLGCHKIDKNDLIAVKVQAKVVEHMQKFLFNQMNYVHILVELELEQRALPAIELKSEESVKLDGIIVNVPLQVQLEDHWRRELGWAGSEDPGRRIKKSHFFTLSQVKNSRRAFESVYEWSHELGEWTERASNYAITMDDVIKAIEEIGKVGAQLKEDLMSQRQTEDIQSTFGRPKIPVNSLVPGFGISIEDPTRVGDKAEATAVQARTGLNDKHRAHRKRKRTPIGAELGDATAEFVPEDGAVLEGHELRPRSVKRIRHCHAPSEGFSGANSEDTEIISKTLNSKVSSARVNSVKHPRLVFSEPSDARATKAQQSKGVSHPKPGVQRPERSRRPCKLDVSKASTTESVNKQHQPINVNATSPVAASGASCEQGASTKDHNANAPDTSTGGVPVSELRSTPTLDSAGTTNNPQDMETVHWGTGSIDCPKRQYNAGSENDRSSESINATSAGNGSQLQPISFQNRLPEASPAPNNSQKRKQGNENVSADMNSVEREVGVKKRKLSSAVDLQTPVKGEGEGRSYGLRFQTKRLILKFKIPVYNNWPAKKPSPSMAETQTSNLDPTTAIQDSSEVQPWTGTVKATDSVRQPSKQALDLRRGKRVRRPTLRKQEGERKL